MVAHGSPICLDKKTFLTGIKRLVTRLPHDLNVPTEDLDVVYCMGLVCNQLRIHDGIETLIDLASQFVARTEKATMPCAMRKWVYCSMCKIQASAW